MRRRPRLLLIAAPLLLGAVSVALWIWATGGRMLLFAMRRASPLAIVALVSITAGWLFLRFLRWQFLLRRVGVRIPVRPSFRIYLAALAGTATPAYVGETVRTVFTQRRFHVPIRVTLPVLVLERVYDVAAITLVGMLATWSLRGSALGLAILAACVLVAGGTIRIALRAGGTAAVVGRLRDPGTAATTLLLSVLAWSLASLLFVTSAHGLGAGLPLGAGVRVYTIATLAGAATLLPAGVAVTGSVAIVQLGQLGIPTSDAVTLVSMARLFSTGLALAVGVTFLWRELRAAPVPSAHDAAAHFDEIASEYASQWSPHVWDMLLKRKMELMEAALPSPPARAGLGLDLGCGLGLQTAEMRRRGYRVVGIDPSSELLHHGVARGLPLAAGSALALPLRPQSLDFVYAIGVLHHLPDVTAQRTAYEEIALALRPGGLLLVHESNPRNPIFRLYMGYIFPLLKQIDEGTEWWIPAEQPLAPDTLRLERVDYFTFLPDFTPRLLMRPAMALERWLERGPTKRYSAHYLAVLRRSDTPAGRSTTEPSGAAG